MTRKDGGPAFPSGERFSIDAAGRRDNRLSQPLHDGMTIRDWFAGQALAGLVGVRDALKVLNGEPEWPWQTNVADAAYMLADAMLSAREAPTHE